MRIIRLILIAASLYAGQTFIDMKNGLMWQDDGVTANAKMTWEEATEYCSGLKLAGYDDWRLPTVKELLTLVDYAREDPAAIRQIRYVRSEDYWTSVTDVSDRSDAWLVFFESGMVDNYDKTHRRHLRCVRKVQKN